MIHVAVLCVSMVAASPDWCLVERCDWRLVDASIEPAHLTPAQPSTEAPQGANATTLVPAGGGCPNGQCQAPQPVQQAQQPAAQPVYQYPVYQQYQWTYPQRFFGGGCANGQCYR
jgi:hypothetical protein